MGTNTLAVVNDGDTVKSSDPNQFVTALIQDFVPRDNTYAPISNSGSLGTATFPWLKLFVSSGGWILGDLKMHHTYNGAAPMGEGWMKCDGRQITQANYDVEHGTGHWATFVGSSPLLNKYLPDFSNKYPVGAASTTQDGSVAITPVGNTSHQINISHSHTVNSHNHQWYNYGGAAVQDTTYDSGGATANVVASTKSAIGGAYVSATAAGSSGNAPAASYTSNASPGTNTQLSATQSIQPESIQVCYYMRII